MTRKLRLAGLAMVAALLLGAAAIVAASAGEPRPASHATVTIAFSKFEPGKITVPAGVPVTFRLENQDPIGHEWIVGDEAVHARHRTGAEPYHDHLPTEVSLKPFETKSTVVTFDTPGDYAFICHLPGHEAYGMRGIIRVVVQD